MTSDITSRLKEALLGVVAACVSSLEDGLVIAAYAVYSWKYGPWDAFSLVCLCSLCVSIARLLQSRVLQWQLRRRGQRTFGSTQKHGYTQKHYMAMANLALTVQWLVSPATPFFLASHWYLLLITPLLGLAIHHGTTRAELSEALADTQTSYAQGAAWGYFLGYLLIISGQSHGSMGEEEVQSFAQCMEEYAKINKKKEDKQNVTLKRRVILIPMKHQAQLSDKNVGESDQTVNVDKKLEGINVGGRRYGQTQVYTINHQSCNYHVAIEEASAIRTAAAAVKDEAAEDFNEDDFEEFARRFLMTLENILQKNPIIAKQVLLVPIEDIQKVGSTVVKCINKIEGSKKEDERLEKLEKREEGSTADQHH